LALASALKVKPGAELGAPGENNFIGYKLEEGTGMDIGQR